MNRACSDISPCTCDRQACPRPLPRGIACTFDTHSEQACKWFGAQLHIPLCLDAHTALFAPTAARAFQAAYPLTEVTETFLCTSFQNVRERVQRSSGPKR